MECFTLKSNNDLILRQLLSARLRRGEVLMLPTDTVYGLSCLADNKAAIDKIFAIKRRDLKLPLLVLVSSLKMAETYVKINKHQREVLKKIWSQARPTSVLLKHRGSLPSNLTAGSIYLALRLPKSVFLRKMIRTLQVPLVSTSANLSGQEVLDVPGALRVFKNNPRPDAALTAGKNKSRESRLLRLLDDGGLQTLRK